MSAFDPAGQAVRSWSGGIRRIRGRARHHPLTADPDIYARDHIHGNARGHAVAFAAIVDALGRPGGRDPLALP